MAEAILRHHGRDRVRAASAGAFPCAHVDPYAIECLRAHGVATTGLRSKGCESVLGAYRAPVRFLITVSEIEVAGVTVSWDRDGNASGPVKAHWGMRDPASVVGDGIDIRTAFETAFGTLDLRIRQFLALPLAHLNTRELAQNLQRIGEGA
jgi:arsenate reductase